ncbi:MAG TPA: YecA family protein [Gammaproteobacteria bacterium]|nr:YecA family protein [Gammaproteobacteria bacterium]
MNTDWYQTLQEALVRAGAVTDAAECHGSLCGWLCGAHESDPRPWIDESLGGADPRNLAAGECRELLLQLHGETRRVLEAAGTDLHLVLPPDSAPLEQRVDELGHWCQGFLHGLGVARPGSMEGLPENSREVIHDFLDVTRAALEPDGDDEEQEGAYAEIVEYIRVGVLLVYEELYPEQDGTSPRRLH